MEIGRVGVVGCGLMGAGIAQLVLLNGYEVVVGEANEALLETGLHRVNEAIKKQVEKGGITREVGQNCLGRLHGTVSLDAFKGCGLVIEAIVENLQAKKDLFMALDTISEKDTIMASNTSSLPITEIAACSSRPEQFIGLHFFNPVPVMSLVEVVKTVATPAALVDAATAFVKSIKKVPVIAKDNAGFIVNLLLTAYLLDAMRAVGEGVASIQDIDTAMKLGCNHPMGPLALADFIGLDTIHSAANTMFEEYKEKRYAPPPVLKRLVTLGYYGKKTGRGFYDWSDPRNPVPMEIA
ncbi:MAG: 3-hydroxybutyryl-CoA dehydrogenase [Syntrophorhabdales bacterium]|jgi:3-hydroxybutyryl-CoA dehydrogenase